MKTLNRRVLVLAALALLMVATRTHHFAAIPDASWALFFIGGFYLRGATRWAFPLLMALAVAVDAAVITRSGLDFWQHACVSPGYWMLLPAYFVLWAGGLRLARGYRGAHWGMLPRAALTLVSAVALCHLFAQGGFYWTSGQVAEPTLAGWWKNYSDWFLPYLGTSALYVGVAAALQLALEQTGKLLHARRDARS